MKNSKSAFLLIVGALSILLSILCFSLNVGGREFDLEYGGDAYTGIQNATAQTATNVYYLSKIVKTGAGSILLVAGCVCIISGLPEPEKSNKRSENNEQLVKTEEKSEAENQQTLQDISLPEI